MASVLVLLSTDMPRLALSKVVLERVVFALHPHSSNPYDVSSGEILLALLSWGGSATMKERCDVVVSSPFSSHLLYLYIPKFYHF